MNNSLNNFLSVKFGKKQRATPKTGPCEYPLWHSCKRRHLFGA